MRQTQRRLTQCVIFDGNGKDAKIIGVEYIISEKLFRKLPGAAGHELMEKTVSAYGKTWHTWHTDQDIELPYGNPVLMMGFTKDSQLNSNLLADRDKRFGVSTADKRRNRADLLETPIQPGPTPGKRVRLCSCPR